MRFDHSNPGDRPSSGRPARATRRTVLKAAGAGTLAAGLGVTGTAAAQESSTPRLSTDGRWIVDPDGQRVRLRGFATAGLDFYEGDHPHKSPRDVLDHATGEGWHPNVVRLPVTEWAVHEEGMQYVVEDLLRPAVDLLAERGVYAMIDFHLVRPYVDPLGNAEDQVEDGWYDSIDQAGYDPHTPTDDLLRQFWGAVAPEFADDEHVLYELYNEPSTPTWWGQYGERGDEVETEEDAWLLWREVAQPWVDLIREEATETPVVIGSPHWTSRTTFAPEYPFEGENLIYAAHIYPPDGAPEEFDDQYGAPAEEVPVVVSEFGWDPDLAEDHEGYGTTSGWGRPFREWVEGYENVGWTAWCFDDSWAPTFFESPADDPEVGAGPDWALKDGEEESGGFVRTWLAETQGDADDSASDEETDVSEEETDASQDGNEERSDESAASGNETAAAESDDGTESEAGEGSDAEADGTPGFGPLAAVAALGAGAARLCVRGDDET